MRTKLSVRVQNFEPLTKIALAAAFGLALALTLSCSSDGGGNNPSSSSVGESGSSSSFAAVSSSGNGSSSSSSGGSSSNGSSNAASSSSTTQGSSSSVVLGSSSSIAGNSSSNGSSSSIASSSSITQGSSSSVVPVSSSSLNGTSNTFTDVRDGKSYRYVKIGTQIWMAENLSYDATGSKCYSGSAGCTTYGRLYNWATAKTACPSGWHLPSDAEWTTLTDFVGGSTAGDKLKARSGWNGGGGTDAYGFTALSGGYGYSDGYLTDIGSEGNWWSATEHNASNAWYRGMVFYSNGVSRDNKDKTLLLTVRCVMMGSSSSSIPSSSSSILVTIETFTDARDSKTYKSVKIGEQVWMAENLNYNATGSKCYSNNTAYCTTYGRLYYWAIAKTACPSGWHLPSNAEWGTLAQFVDPSSCSFNSATVYCNGKLLKATSGWNSNCNNGTDDYGFLGYPKSRV